MPSPIVTRRSTSRGACSSGPGDRPGPSPTGSTRTTSDRRTASPKGSPSDDLERWQAALRTQHAADSDVPGEQATSLFVTLRWLAAQTETPVAPEIAARVRAPVSYPRPRRGSVDELAPRDRQAIEAAARSGIERLKRSRSLSRSSTGDLGDALALARLGMLTPTRFDDRYGPTLAELPAELRTVLELNHIPVREDPEAAARRAAGEGGAGSRP